ncbi:MAG TPA: BON domain-containing protein [Solirubrobacteraceae bacterium]
MPNLNAPFRGLARQSASLLRATAGLLEKLAGGRKQPAAPQQTPKAGVVRPTASARRTPRAAKETPKRRATTRRQDRQRSTAPKPLDDVTIARKVETEIFRDPSVPKGHIDVNVVGGVVWLRGEVRTPEDIKSLEAQAQAVPEVKRVENLLHLPNTPAPTRTDTPARQRKPAGRRTKPRSADVHVTPDRVTAEVPTPGAEPSPADLASRHEGRQPAPLGSHNGGGEGAEPA